MGGVGDGVRDCMMNIRRIFHVGSHVVCAFSRWSVALGDEYSPDGDERSDHESDYDEA